METAINTLKSKLTEFKGRRGMNTAFHKPGNGWAINVPLMHGLQVHRYTILPLFPKRKACRPDSPGCTLGR